MTNATGSLFTIAGLHALEAKQARTATARGYRSCPGRPTEGHMTFHYCLADVPLVCEVYWEAAEKQTYTEPGWPANATLESADCGGLNIIQILSDEQIEEIETAFLEQES